MVSCFDNNNFFQLFSILEKIRQVYFVAPTLIDNVFKANLSHVSGTKIAKQKLKLSSAK